MKISRFSFVNNAGLGLGGVKVVAWSPGTVPLVPFVPWIPFPLTPFAVLSMPVYSVAFLPLTVSTSSAGALAGCSAIEGSMVSTPGIFLCFKASVPLSVFSTVHKCSADQL